LFDKRPTGLQAFSGHAGEPIARLNACEGFARSMLMGLIPLLALEALGSKEMVTRAYLAASILTLLITLIVISAAIVATFLPPASSRH
jgi:ACDE family multidrug resistance protein